MTQADANDRNSTPDSNRRSFFRRAGAVLASLGLGTAGTQAAEASPPDDSPSQKRRRGNVVTHGDEPLFSGTIVHGGLVYLAGIGAHFDGDIQDHTDHVLSQMEQKLQDAGSSMEQALKVTVYLHDLGDYEPMNEVFRGRFGDNPPVRSTVATYGGVPGDSLVEMDCVAALEEE
jgi:enamine deaminase RidA (YjgF/YER057c/UK114 family)